MPLLILGCVPKTVVPIPSTAFHDQGHPTYVWLPGRHSRMTSFGEQGFLSIAEEYGRPRLVFVDAHLGYYMNRTLVDRIRADVLSHESEGRVVLAGISLGGLGAITVTLESRGMVDELLLFSPFLGDDKLLQRVRDNQLTPRDEDDRKTRKILEIWRFLLREEQIPITVFCGRSDRLADAIRLLEQHSSHQVHWVDGGHDWHTWRKMWRLVLAQGS